MAFGFDDAALAALEEGAKETAKEVAEDVGETAKDSFSSQNQFNPSDFNQSSRTFETNSSDIRYNGSNDVNKSIEDEFSPDKFTETGNLEAEKPSVADAQAENAIERTSTFEEQTIDNFKLEDMRPEINKKLTLEVEHSGEVLRQNLEVVTGQNPEASNAHHLVGNDTPRAAEILDKYGIDRNDPANGIFLPDSTESTLKGSVHGQGRHISEYSNEVEERFLNVESREEALEVLQSLKEDLYDGNLALHYNVEPNK